MELETLEIPCSSNQIIKAYKKYYKSFESDAIHINNNNFNDFFEKYFDLLLRLCKQHGPDQIRAAIGILSLHSFGYHNFKDLVKLFDRIIPQRDYEYIKFTSWVAGCLIHHPDIEEGRYVGHLLVRLYEWTNANGRRARHLNAVELLAAIAENAGNYVVTFFPNLQIIIWSLVSHQSLQVLKATANAIQKFLKAILKYGRADLEKIMNFFVSLCLKLLGFEDPIKGYAALLLLEVLIKSYPTYFISQTVRLIKLIYEDFETSTVLVQGQIYVVLACLSEVDPQYFVDMVASELFDITNDLIVEFPTEIAKALRIICKNVPIFVESRLTDFMGFIKILLQDVQNQTAAFTLLTIAVDKFGSKIFPLDFKFIDKDIVEIDKIYISFIVKVLKIMTQLIKNPYETYSRSVIKKIFQRILLELQDDSEQKYFTIRLISKMPISCFCQVASESEHLINTNDLLNQLWKLTTDENADIRKTLPKAIFNIAKNKSKNYQDITLSIEEAAKRFMQIAIFEQVTEVRCSIFKALLVNCVNVENLAGPEFIPFYRIFLEDETYQVQEYIIKFISKICSFNPMPLISIIRETLLNSFFIIRHVPQIQKKATTMRLLPSLIKALELTIKAFSKACAKYSVSFIRFFLKYAVECP